MHLMLVVREQFVSLWLIAANMLHLLTLTTNLLHPPTCRQVSENKYFHLKEHTIALHGPYLCNCSIYCTYLIHPIVYHLDLSDRFCQNLCIFTDCQYCSLLCTFGYSDKNLLFIAYILHIIKVVGAFCDVS